MNVGKELREKAKQAQEKQAQEKLIKSEENLKNAKEELSKYMESDLRKILENMANKGSMYWCRGDSFIESILSQFGLITVISVFKTMGLKFFTDPDELNDSYFISWD